MRFLRPSLLLLALSAARRPGPRRLRRRGRRRDHRCDRSQRRRSEAGADQGGTDLPGRRDLRRGQHRGRLGRHAPPPNRRARRPRSPTSTSNLVSSLEQLGTPKEGGSEYAEVIAAAEELAKVEGEVKLAAEREDSAALAEAERERGHGARRIPDSRPPPSASNSAARARARRPPPPPPAAKAAKSKKAASKPKTAPEEYVPPAEEGAIEEVAPEGGGAAPGSKKKRRPKAAAKKDRPRAGSGPAEVRGGARAGRGSVLRESWSRPFRDCSLMMLRPYGAQESDDIGPSGEDPENRPPARIRQGCEFRKLPGPLANLKPRSSQTRPRTASRTPRWPRSTRRASPARRSCRRRAPRSCRRGGSSRGGGR